MPPTERGRTGPAFQVARGDRIHWDKVSPGHYKVYMRPGWRYQPAVYSYYLTRRTYYKRAPSIFPKKMREGDVVVDWGLRWRRPETARELVAELETRLLKLRENRDALLAQKPKPDDWQERHRKIMQKIDYLMADLEAERQWLEGKPVIQEQ